MRKFATVALLSMILVGSAFAEETQHCYKGNSDLVHICEFQPSGRVNLTDGPYPDGAYYSRWFTHAEWLRYKSNPNNIDVYQRPTNHNSEAEAQSWHTQHGCEADGFVWHDGGCHAK
jgi:hypothetical protein